MLQQEQRSQVRYGDAETYRPERWIVNDGAGNTKEDMARIKANFHPFAAGPGMCVANGLTMSEILLTVARTLHRLEVKRVPGSSLGGSGHQSMAWGERDPMQMQVLDAYVSIRHGPEVQFRTQADGRAASNLPGRGFR